jgi:hypothetical protein
MVGSCASVSEVLNVIFAPVRSLRNDPVDRQCCNVLVSTPSDAKTMNADLYWNPYVSGKEHQSPAAYENRKLPVSVIRVGASADAGVAREAEDTATIRATTRARTKPDARRASRQGQGRRQARERPPARRSGRR